MAGAAAAAAQGGAYAQNEFEGEVAVEGQFVDENGAMPVEENFEEAPAEEEFVEEVPPIMPTPVRQQPEARPVRRPIERVQGGDPNTPRPRTPPPPPGPRPGQADSGNNKDNPNNIKDGATPQGEVDFDFNGTDILEVVKSISILTGRNFDVDPSVGNIQVTLITHEKIPPEMAFEVLESVLASRGFRMVETLDGKLIKIMPDPNARRSEKVPVLKGMVAPEEGYDGLSTHIVPIKFANPEELRDIMQQL
ncbi:MAG: type secretion system protein GspD, partial [Candidatus Hydrogenedentota bacterium]